ncbi:Leucine-rich repeat containing protein [Methanosarcina siciliae C2J]|uniref:non-specific serine/threonine protein kinase n=1 Tax=Methanosarcina siciliae C2J TaxID=1434118 RepID=A0A0E3LDD9_9EURY|nr:COR domain-containing protein [Methanosarcina siciliae]AKB37101.1 Leucine-rich repeat containing protein [Methanosarcina siciliae C2J]
MTNERVLQFIREAFEKNLTVLNLSENQLTQLPSEIGELVNLKTLDLSFNELTQLPPEITELKNLTTLDLSRNQLTQLPPEITELKNLTELYLYSNQLTQLPPEITELKNLTELNLSWNQLTQLPPEITELKNLTILSLSSNQLTQLPPEITELKNLTTLDLSLNELTQLPPEITELKNLTELYLYSNQLTQLPPEITELKNLTILSLSLNQLTQLPPEIGELKNLITLYLHSNQLTQLPPEITKLKNLIELDLSFNGLTQLPPEITELKNLTILSLHSNQLIQLPPEITKLKNLIELNLSGNQLTQLPPEITELKNLTILSLSLNQLTQLPPEITELKNLTTLDLSKNPLTSPPPEIVSKGVKAIFTYLKQSRTYEHNEAKLILVGAGGVGKTCLVNRLINDVFVEDQITEGINISEWDIPVPYSGNGSIKLNIWDFGGQEIYHSTHQFFLTKRSVYILVWNARKTKDYDNIYYWLHTLEAFGEDSPIILVMTKMNESDDDLNLKDLKSKFPQIAGYLKIDSKDGKGINSLKEIICEIAWNLSLMRAKGVDSWYEVRKELKGIGENRIPYDKFCEICRSKGLDSENVDILDGYLHDLGVTLHFRDRIGLKNIVILKPEWATGAFYKILSAKSVLHSEGVLLQNELDQIWDKETYLTAVHQQLMELMNKFELAYELPDKSSYLIPELLPKNEPDYDWDDEENLYFYYSYESFLPSGIITRFIVRMHQDIEKKEDGMSLCWREGAVLQLQNSRALVKMRLDEKQIEIRIKGDNKRGALGAICNELDQINSSIKKISISKLIPCNCSKNCPERYSYEKLLKAEMKREETIQCHESYEHISISLLLDGYKRREERFNEYKEGENLKQLLLNNLVISPNFNVKAVANPAINVEPKIDVNTNINVNLKIDLPLILNEFDDLKDELENLNPKIDRDLNKIQDSLYELSPNSDKEKLFKPLNKLNRFLTKLSDPDSDYNKVITGTQKGIEQAQKLGRTYNKFAQWLAMPQVPDLFLGI